MAGQEMAFNYLNDLVVNKYLSSDLRNTLLVKVGVGKEYCTHSQTCQHILRNGFCVFCGNIFLSDYFGNIAWGHSREWLRIIDWLLIVEDLELASRSLNKLMRMNEKR